MAEAEGLIQEAFRLEPENFEYSYHLALLLTELGKTQESREKLEKTVELNPGFGRAWYNLGLAYVEENNLDQALQALTKAEELMPQSPQPPEVLADLYRKKGKRAMSYKKFIRAKRLREKGN